MVLAIDLALLKRRNFASASSSLICKASSMAYLNNYISALPTQLNYTVQGAHMIHAGPKVSTDLDRKVTKDEDNGLRPSDCFISHKKNFAQR